MMKMMQMQQQQTQQMQMNFVQAQQQQSQLFACLQSGIESYIYNFCCDSNFNILLVLKPLFILVYVYVIMYIHVYTYLYFPPLLSYIIYHINSIKYVIYLSFISISQ